MSESKDFQKISSEPTETSKSGGGEQSERAFEIEDWMKAGRSSRKSRKTLKSVSDEKFQYRLGMYIRLSPSDEIREEGSLVSHPQRIQEYVKHKNLSTPGWGTIVEKYEDKDVSGKDMNRPAYLQMLADIKAGRINGVIVTELSRLNRNVKDFLQFWEFLKRYNGKFFSLKENFDTSTAIGEMMVIQSVSFAQFERNSIVERIRYGARARAERGLSNGSQRCLGYDIDPHRKNYLVVNETERPVVRLIFEKFLELGTVEKTREWLNGKGYRTKEYVSKEGKPHGGKKYTHSSLYGLLTNKTYMGLREFNKGSRSAHQEDLEPNERYRVAKAVWPAIIEPGVFRAAQERLEKNAKTSRKFRHVYSYSGLADCELCGAELVGKSATGRKNVHYYYGHNRKFTNKSDAHSKRCPIERIPALEIEAAMLGRLRLLAKNPKLVAQIAKDSQQGKSQSISSQEKLIELKKAEIAETKGKITNLAERIATLPKDFPTEGLLESLQKLEAKKEAAATGLKALEAELRTAGQVVDMRFVFNYLQLFNRDKFDKLTPTEQREIIGGFVHRITLGKNKIHAQYYGQENEDIFDWKDSEGSEKKAKTNLEGPRSGVLPSFELVEVAGIEPASEINSRRRPTSLVRIFSYPRGVYAQTTRGRSLLSFRIPPACQQRKPSPL
jgi:site-specific DNA recombinase